MSYPNNPQDPYAKSQQPNEPYGQQPQQGYGAPQGYGQPMQNAPYQGMTGENKKALPALICSILGWFCGILAIVGVVLGVIAQKEIRSSGGMQTGEGKAKAAIIVGAIAIVINVAYGIYVATQ